MANFQKANTSCAECNEPEPATFAYRWPGSEGETFLCDVHMLGFAAHADPLKLAVRALGASTLEQRTANRGSETRIEWYLSAPTKAEPVVKGEPRRDTIKLTE